jgi:hypothetical protein
MADEHQRTDEPSDEEREETIGDLEPADEEADAVKGGQGMASPRKE